MRKRVLVFILPLLLLAALAAPIAADPIYVHDYGDAVTDVSAGDSARFEWVVYNNDTVPYLLEVTPSLDRTSDAWSVSAESNATVIEPGEHAVVVAVLDAHRDVGNEDLVLSMVFQLTKLNDPSMVIQFEKTAEVTLHAMFESTGNKIFGVWPNNLPSPFNTLLWSFLITLGVWVAIGAVIYFVVNPIVNQFTKRTKTELDDRVLGVIRMPLFIIIVLYGLVDSLAILSLPTEWHIQIWQAYQIVAALVMAWLAYRIFDRVVIYYAEKWSKKSDTEIDDVLVPLLHKLGIIAIPLVGLVAVLGILGIDVTLLVAGLGVVGLVVAFAAQQTLGNLFSGIQILMDRPFKVGDLLELDSGEITEVRKVGLRSTHLFNIDEDEIIIVPNNDMANKKIVNWSRPDNKRCIWAEVRVAFGTDLAKVEKLLIDIVMEHPEVVKEKTPLVRLNTFGDSGAFLKIWYWVTPVRAMWRVNHWVKNTIYTRFREEGIEIPYPHSVIALKEDLPEDVLPGNGK